MSIRTILYSLGGLLLLVGAALPVFPSLMGYAPAIYSAGALLFGAVQVTTPLPVDHFAVRRLHRQQTLGALCLVVAGGMMFMSKYQVEPCAHDEWKLALAIGAVIELYTSFRLPAVIEKINREG